MYKRQVCARRGLAATGATGATGAAGGGEAIAWTGGAGVCAGLAIFTGGGGGRATTWIGAIGGKTAGCQSSPNSTLPRMTSAMAQ